MPFIHNGWLTATQQQRQEVRRQPDHLKPIGPIEIAQARISWTSGTRSVRTDASNFIAELSDGQRERLTRELQSKGILIHLYDLETIKQKYYDLFIASRTARS